MHGPRSWSGTEFGLAPCDRDRNPNVSVPDAKLAWKAMPATLDRLIGGKTVGLLYLPPDYAAPRMGWRAIWRRHIVANAAVRDREYMAALFQSRFPSGNLHIVENDHVPTEVLAAADTVVLLFPDAIGVDWQPIERQVHPCSTGKRLLMLNGRRRLLRLDSETRQRLARRRFLETWRLPEFAFLSIFVIVTPILAFLDLIRGRR
jgi:hypothetical protein